MNPTEQDAQKKNMPNHNQLLNHRVIFSHSNHRYISLDTGEADHADEHHEFCPGKRGARRPKLGLYHQRTHGSRQGRMHTSCHTAAFSKRLESTTTTDISLYTTRFFGDHRQRHSHPHPHPHPRYHQSVEQTRLGFPTYFQQTSPHAFL